MIDAYEIAPTTFFQLSSSEDETPPALENADERFTRRAAAVFTFLRSV